MAYGSYVLQKDLSFDIRHKDIFIIMGGSGSGKSTLMRHIVGLKEPACGRVLFENRSFWEVNPEEQDQLKRRFGVMFQQGALWSSMTLSENVMLPIQQFTKLPASMVAEIASLKLALVGLTGFERYYPSEISGGMRKRAAIARAMALDPDTLILDEPSAGLDPLSARRLDDLVLELRESLDMTIIVVTHELQSIFTIGDNSVFLDANIKTMSATGHPAVLRDHSDNDYVRSFLRRGEMVESTPT